MKNFYKYLILTAVASCILLGKGVMASEVSLKYNFDKSNLKEISKNELEPHYEKN